ncbi:hypothetical protein [Streptomyces aureoversilis]|uniref:Uncharacterized protein n=1 Tax=Streptomyces aureoversilis TaxID=67277 RepID=A0ABV9ZWU0_9ACTN
METALLGDWVGALGHGTATDAYLAALPRQHADTEHRRLQPLWERRVRGKRVTSLRHEPAEGLTLGDAIRDDRSPEAAILADEFTDSRLAVVLRGLCPAESAVARNWARTGDTWAVAAAGAGLGEAYGERVRRKLQRLGDKYTKRAAAAAAWRKEQVRP